MLLLSPAEPSVMALAQPQQHALLGSEGRPLHALHHAVCTLLLNVVIVVAFTGAVQAKEHALVAYLYFVCVLML